MFKMELPLAGNKTKDLVIQAFAQEHPLTVRRLYSILKNQYQKSVTENNVRKIIYDLYNNKVLARKGNEYYLSLDFLDQLKLLSEKVRESYLNKNILENNLKTKINSLAKRKELLHCETCNTAQPEGFCLLCLEMVCKGCGELVRVHTQCKKECEYCNNASSNCAVCFGKCCPHCSKEVWIHHSGHCKKAANNQAVIGLVEVDHQCWFSNLSEKTNCSPELTTFIDNLDRKYNTHSGKLILEIEKEKHKKIIEQIYKNEQITSIKPVFADKKRIILRTRALFKNSFEESTHKNNAVILNPVIATNTKEKNIVIAPNMAELKKMINSFKEQGTCKLSFHKQVSLANLNTMLGKNFSYIDQQDLNEAVRKFQIIHRINDLFGGIKHEV